MKLKNGKFEIFKSQNFGKLVNFKNGNIEIYKSQNFVKLENY